MGASQSSFSDALAPFPSIQIQGVELVSAKQPRRVDLNAHKGSLRLLPRHLGARPHSVQKEAREEGPNAPSLPGPMTELDPMGQRDHREAAGGAGGSTQGLR